jgi:hypothetical protein
MDKVPAEEDKAEQHPAPHLGVQCAVVQVCSLEKLMLVAMQSTGKERPLSVYVEPNVKSHNAAH